MCCDLIFTQCENQIALEIGGTFPHYFKEALHMSVNFTSTDSFSPVSINTVAPDQVLNALLDSIQTLGQNRSEYCVHPETDFTRPCRLDFSTVVKTILCFGSSTVRGELSTTFGILNPDADLPTKNAFIMRRQLIRPSAFQFLFNAFMSHFTDFKTQYGYRILASDCTIHSIPSNSKDYNTMVQGKPGTKPYHQLAIETLHDALTDVIVDAVVNDFNDFSEEKAFLQLAGNLKNPETCIITADRYYGSLNNIAHLSRIGAHFVLRCKDIDSNGFASSYQLPDSEFDRSFHKKLTFHRRNADADIPDLQVIVKRSFDFFDESDYFDVNFRLVRVDLGGGNFELLVTDLPRDLFPPDVIREIYWKRWKIETSFRRIKHIMASLFFHSYKHDSVLQEIFAKLIMYNFATLVSAAVSIPPTPGKKQKRFVYFSVAVCESRYCLLGKINASSLLKRLRQDPCIVRPDRVVSRNKRLDNQPAKPFNARAV